MTNWTARIALIAYVLGGWLLPATHHHGSHARQAVVGNTSTHPISKHGGCGHKGCCHHVAAYKIPSNVPKVRVASLEVGPAPAAACCSGLCALCVARTLTSDPVSIDLEGFWDFVTGERIAMASQSIPMRQPLGSISSRGPPIIL